MKEIESELLSQLKIRLEEIEEKYRYLSYLIKNRLANEKLFQLEIMKIVSSLPSVVEYLPEKPYQGKREKCDFWFKTKTGKECWMEIKTIPTNYKIEELEKPHSKGISRGRMGVIDDIERLRKNAPPDAVKYIAFAFYPIDENHSTDTSKEYTFKKSTII